MNKSEQINELAAALAKAQGATGLATKDAVNTFYQNKPYADLADIWSAARAHLSANGLAVTMLTDTSENGTVLETMLMHSSGQWVASCYPVKPVKDDPQGLKSALTYARRASLECIANIVAEDGDDDGNDSSDISWNKAEERAMDAAQRAIELITEFDSRAKLEKWHAGAIISLERVKKLDEKQFARIQTAYNIKIAELAEVDSAKLP